ncbi:MAG: class I SAM-dependent methyltransferase [Chloroflexota bacterium]
MTQAKIEAGLTDVPETMLWTLHNRAPEAMRSDGIIKDPEAIRIYQSINYDYERSFGRTTPTHAIRSLVFDKQIRKFLTRHPNGVVVNLGEGLETQRFRVKSEQSLWFTVDLPEAIAVREKFIPPDAQHHHIRLSVLDRDWFEVIPHNRPIFITAQGLFMYFPEQEVKKLMQDIGREFPFAWLMFDNIPVWFSNRTMKGFKLTPHYTAPPMPWGINKPDIELTLRTWVPTVAKIESVPFPNYPRGFGRLLYGVLMNLPGIKNMSPSVTLMQFGD